MDMAKEQQKLFEAAADGDLRFFDGKLHFFDGKRVVNIPAKVPVWENSEGDKATHVAAKHGQTEFFLKLLERNHEILNTRNRSGDTPLHCALKWGRPEFVEGFAASPSGLGGLAEDFALNGEGKSLVYLAVEKGYTKTVKSLLETGGLDRADGPDGYTALHAAVSKKHSDIIDALVEYCPLLTGSRDREEQVPLHLAVQLNDPELVKHLLTANPASANVLNKDGISPFHLATRIQYLHIFQLFWQLCSTCRDTTTRQRQNVLHIAVEAKNEDIVKFILEDEKLSEQMINQTDADGNTPLHIAASNDDEKMQNILLKYKENVQTIRNRDGLTFSDITNARKDRKLKEKKERMQSKLLKATEDFQSGLLVMATLITTVTFTAAFTLPGGYKGDGQDQGMATLAGRAAFKVFLISDTTSMVNSIITTASLILFSVISSNRQEKFFVLIMAIGSIVISIVSMLVSFTAGLWVVIGSNGKWLVILIAVVVSCTPLPIVLVIGCVYRATIWYEDEEGALIP